MARNGHGLSILQRLDRFSNRPESLEFDKLNDSDENKEGKDKEVEIEEKEGEDDDEQERAIVDPLTNDETFESLTIDELRDGSSTAVSSRETSESLTDNKSCVIS